MEDSRNLSEKKKQTLTKQSEVSTDFPFQYFKHFHYEIQLIIIPYLNGHLLLSIFI